MASDYEEDSDLEALRSAVLASLKTKPKQTNSLIVKNERSRNDVELEELRIAALHSKRPQDEIMHASILSHPRFPTSRGFRRDFGHLHKGLNRNNLIVIQPLPLEESIQQEPSSSSLDESVKPVMHSLTPTASPPTSSLPPTLMKSFGRYFGVTDEEASQSPRPQKTKSSGKFSRFESDSDHDSSESDYSDSEESNKSPLSSAESSRKSECSDDVEDENSNSSDILLLHPDEPLQETDLPLINDQDDSQDNPENGTADSTIVNEVSDDKPDDTTLPCTEQKEVGETQKQPNYDEWAQNICDVELSTAACLEKDSCMQLKERELHQKREDNYRDAHTNKVTIKHSSCIHGDRVSHKRQSSWELRVCTMSHRKDGDRKHLSVHNHDTSSEHGKSKRKTLREEAFLRNEGNATFKDCDIISLKVPSREKVKFSKEEVARLPKKKLQDSLNARFASRDLGFKQRTESPSPSTKERPLFANDLRQKLKSHNRIKGANEKAHTEVHECVKQNSRNSSAERSKSQSPVVKSVLRVVKLNSRDRAKSRRNSKRSKRKAKSSLLTPASTEIGGDKKNSYSPVQCDMDKSPRERKVLLVTEKSFSDDDRTSERTGFNITFIEDTNGVSNKQRLPVHLRLGGLPNSSNSDSKTAIADSLLKTRYSDRGYRSSSPSFTTKQSSSKRLRLSDDEVDLPRKVKLRRDAFHSSKSLIHASKTNGFSSKTSKSRSGKTYENELDEKIRRIRAKNQAIMKRKCEIEQDEQVSNH